MEQNRAAAIRLTDAGSFQVDRDGPTAELCFDAFGGEAAWSVTVFDAQGRCLHAEHFADLDAGLDRLADLGRVERTGLRNLYRVALPDGRSFQRPGSLPAASVLRMLGFDFHDNVATFLVVAKDEATDRTDAFALFRERLGMLAPLLRSVEAVAVDGDGDLWCAEILLSVNGFYQPKGLLDFAMTSVGACGVEMLPKIGMLGPDDVDAPAVLPFAARA
jgi:hypothetical protein